MRRAAQQGAAADGQQRVPIGVGSFLASTVGVWAASEALLAAAERPVRWAAGRGVSGDAIRVRLAHSGDADQLASLNAFVQDAHVRAHPNWFRPTELLELRDWFRNLLLRPEARVWIAESDRAPIGYISLLVF